MKAIRSLTRNISFATQVVVGVVAMVIISLVYSVVERWKDKPEEDQW